MNVFIKQMFFENFKGLKQYALAPYGKPANIYGDNGTGKTTLMDGFLWVLTGKDSLGRADFEIKTLTPAGEPLHGLNHSVELALDVDGKDLTLKKTLTEKWVKKRGSASKEFTGHDYNHWIDGVPCSKGEFEAKIAEVIPEETLRLLTSPAYFLGQMKWQDRRKVLLSICGDLSDSDVISSDSALADLSKILGTRSIDDHRKVIASRRAEINKELTVLPARIDEVERSLPDITGLDASALQAEAGTKNERMHKLAHQIMKIENGGEIADKTSALAEIEGKLLEINNA